MFLFKKRYIGLFLVVFLVFSLVPLSRRMLKTIKQKKQPKVFFTLKSSAFESGRDIPSIYTCDGRNISPPLAWEHPPVGTKSFVLICHDPDDALTGVRIQWIVYNIPQNIRQLSQQVRVEAINAKLGLNSWQNASYIGPCPPLKTHRYFFTLYALNIPELVEETPTYQQVQKAMKEHVLGKARIMGRYHRVEK